MDNKYLSRKFLLTVIILILGFVLVLQKLLPVETWFIFAQTSIAVYATANIADSTLNKKDISTPEPLG